MMVKLEYGTKMVLMKYGNTPHNCIDLHIEELKKNGFCWFGKIGVSPSISVIRNKIGTENFLVLLYCQGEIYICNCIDVKNERPSEFYPHYYESFLFEKRIEPKIYFCLDSIEKADQDLFKDCVILSSRNRMFDVVSRSMASFFYVEYADPQLTKIEKKKTQIKQSDEKRKTQRVVSKNDCLYREAGKCTNRRSINYEYECTRPSSCMKQKIK